MENKIQLKDKDGNNIYPIVLAEHMTGLLSTEDVEDINNEYDETILNLVYPVGALYWSSSSTNPATLFGGTWTQIKDKFVLSAGDNYTANTTGGSTTHTHGALNYQNGSLNAQIGSGASDTKSLAFKGSNINLMQKGTYWVGGNGYSSPAENQYNSHNTAVFGESDSSSIIPPYKVNYCWERIA